MIAKHHLRKLGDRVRSVTESASMAETESALAAGGQDVVLLDLTLPDSPMEDTIRAIESLARHGVPIVATSSLDADDIRKGVMNRGAAAFLSKARMDAAHLGEVFDAVSGGAASPETGGTGRSGSPSLGAEAARVASKLAHDANSWIANASFRLACLRPGAEGDEQATAHLDSIEASLQALTSIAAGARGLVADEGLDLGTGSVEVDDDALDPWRAADGRNELELTVDALPPVAVDRAALGTVLGILADNVARHGGDSPASMRLSEEPGAPEGHVHVLVEDGGGPWTVDGERDLTELGTRGTRRTPTAGVGLHRARRLMQRMGGDLEIATREGSAHAIRLTFRRA